MTVESFVNTVYVSIVIRHYDIQETVCVAAKRNCLGMYQIQTFRFTQHWAICMVINYCIVSFYELRQCLSKRVGVLFYLMI